MGTYEFDGDLLVGADVGSMVDISKGSTAELARKSVLSSDSKFHLVLVLQFEMLQSIKLTN